MWAWATNFTDILPRLLLTFSRVNTNQLLAAHLDSLELPGCSSRIYRYFSKWISAYDKLLPSSTPIWGVTVQNEPENKALWESLADLSL